MSTFEVSDEAREALRSDLSHALEMWFGSHLYNWPDNPTRYFGQPASDAIDAFLRSKMLAEYRDHRIAELDNAVSDLLRERDEWEERLTALCYAIAPVEQIGEWSSANELDESAAEAAAQIRAERDAALARVQELEPFQVAHADLYRRYLAALAVIEKAPHADGCNALLRTRGVTTDPTPLPCTCWKSSVDTSALAARDTEKWNEGAEATTEWMVNNPSPSGIPHDPPLNPYSALAEKGADTRTAEEREAAYWAGAGCEEDDRG